MFINAVNMKVTDKIYPNMLQIKSFKSVNSLASLYILREKSLAIIYNGVSHV